MAAPLHTTTQTPWHACLDASQCATFSPPQIGPYVGACSTMLQHVGAPMLLHNLTTTNRLTIQPATNDTQIILLTHARHLRPSQIGTDSMLLGAWSEPGDARHILDIGTGTGVLALMVAQKSHPEAMVDAIDVDMDAYHQALRNAEACPWPGRIRVHHMSLQQLVAQHSTGAHDAAGTSIDTCTATVNTISTTTGSSFPTCTNTNTTNENYTNTAMGLSTTPQQPSRPAHYDLIISNPPFFVNSYKSPEQGRSVARHADEALPFPELAAGAAALLRPGGALRLVLPPVEARAFCSCASSAGFQLVSTVC